jgi:hypothetical protein
MQPKSTDVHSRPAARGGDVAGVCAPPTEVCRPTAIAVAITIRVKWPRVLVSSSDFV